MMLERRKLWSIAAAFGALLHCWNPAMAQESSAGAGIGFSLEQLIQINLQQQVLLKIPAGYLYPWPSPKERAQVNHRNVIAFSFWLSSRRYLEVNPLSNLGFHPRERERSPPDSDSVILVRSLTLVGGISGDYITPEKQFDNLISGFGPASSQVEKFGLVRFWYSNWPHANPQPFVNFRTPAGADPQILFRCTPPSEAVVGTNCDGSIYLVADRIAIYVQFSGEELPRWREIVDAVRNFYSRWKIDG